MPLLRGHDISAMACRGPATYMQNAAVVQFAVIMCGCSSIPGSNLALCCLLRSHVYRDGPCHLPLSSTRLSGPEHKASARAYSAALRQPSAFQSSPVAVPFVNYTRRCKRHGSHPSHSLFYAPSASKSSGILQRRETLDRFNGSLAILMLRFFSKEIIVMPKLKEH